MFPHHWLHSQSGHIAQARTLCSTASLLSPTISPASSGFIAFGRLPNPSRQFLPLRSRQPRFTKPKNGKSHSRTICPLVSVDLPAIRKLVRSRSLSFAETESKLYSGSRPRSGPSQGEVSHRLQTCRSGYSNPTKALGGFLTGSAPAIHAGLRISSRSDFRLCP